MVRVTVDKIANVTIQEFIYYTYVGCILINITKGQQ